MFDGSSRHPTDPFSSLDAVQPIVLKQAYITPFQVTALAVTHTRHGITEKQLLVAQPSGAIVGVNKRFIDARRPTNEKATKHAEGLMRLVSAPIVRRGLCLMSACIVQVPSNSFASTTSHPEL